MADDGCCGKIGDTEKWAKKEPECKFVDYEERGCGDHICFVAFFAFAALVIYIISLANAAGADPMRIINGVDASGIICGEGANLDNPVAIWPYPFDYNLKFCAPDCTSSNEDIRMYSRYESEDYLGYCIPTDITQMIADQNISAFTEFGFSGDVSAAISDVYNTSAIIGCSVFIAMLCALLYTKIVGTCGYALIMGCALLMIVFGFLMAYYFYNQSLELIANGDTDGAQYMEIGCYVTVALTVILAIVIFAIRKRIEMAVSIIKAAGQAMRDMPMVMCFPIVPLLMGCAYIALWIYMALCILSVTLPEQDILPELLTTYPGSVDDLSGQTSNYWSGIGSTSFPGFEQADGTFITGSYKNLVFDTSYQAHFAVVFFHLLWVVQFFIYFNFLVISGAVAQWYFVPVDESTGDKTEMPAGMVLGSCKRACRFNIGSIAFGSFIIAVVDFIRVVVKYIEEKAKSAGEPNMAQKALFCAIQCCLTCLRCCLDKLSKNAYCWIAAWGGSFLPGACSAFKLFLEPENIIRAAAMNFTSSILLFCGKSFVALMTTGLCCIIITYTVPVSTLLLPAVMIFIIALFVGHIFMLEFDVAVDQIFLCFLVDEKTNENVKFGTKSLRSVFHKQTQEFKKTDAYKKLGDKDIEMDKKAESA